MSIDVAALTALLRALQARDYTFVTPTPVTHARVISRKASARDLRDVFGWSLPCTPDLLDDDLLALLRDGRLVETDGALLRSRVRISSLSDDLYAHSAFPTTQADSVFFGPDSYRFARFLNEALPHLGERRHIVDMGAGAGIGAATAARALPHARVTLIDINPRALDMARANWACAGLQEASFIQGNTLSAAPDDLDLIIANPPYIADDSHRAYRDGGALHGAQISVEWARQAVTRLQRGGAFLLYTGTAVINGVHALEAPLRDALPGFDISYCELDPDVFGEELERESYADVERIAVVGVIAIKR